MDRLGKKVAGAAALIAIAGLGFVVYKANSKAGSAAVVTTAQCEEHDDYRNRRASGGKADGLPNSLVTAAILRSCERQGIKLTSPAPKS